jgi:hypothetical protein
MERRESSHPRRTDLSTLSAGVHRPRGVEAARSGELLGLGATDDDPDTEVGYLLSALAHIDLPRRRESNLATVILDLCSVLELGELYAEGRHEFLAVDAHPHVLHLPDTPAALRRDGEGVEVEIGPPYAAHGRRADTRVADGTAPPWRRRAGMARGLRASSGGTRYLERLT